MENLYLTKLEQAIKDGNYKMTTLMHQSKEFFDCINQIGETNNLNSKIFLAQKSLNFKVDTIYRITFKVIIYYPYPSFEKQFNYVENALFIEEEDQKHLIDVSDKFNPGINRKFFIDQRSGCENIIYSRDVFLLESEIIKIQENIFIKEKEHEKNLLLKVMEVNNETTTKKRWRL